MYRAHYLSREASRIASPCDLNHRRLFLGPLCKAGRKLASSVYWTPLCQGDPMRAIHTCLSRLSMAAVSVVLLSAEPGLGQSMPVPCSAFARNAHGGWKVLAPVILYIDGRPLGPMVGSILPAASMPNSMKVSETLDRECGNRVIWPTAVSEHER